MSERETRLCDAEALARLLTDMAQRIVEGRRANAPLRLVGIRSRGVPIAERLAKQLAPLVGDEIPVGAVDITMYRDDLAKSERWPVLRGTEIPFDVDGVEVVLVDDVLFTGRTVRAALNEICDLGRPACVRLAVLADRGQRELPIQPDVVGLQLNIGRQERIQVRVAPIDPVDEVVRIVQGR
jgi:pyrimidine operon attenuation protein/uracil phosphoribosyltransferase